ncbi:hypothetical protein MRX96_033652 [Rhipicephalus microplus]
MFFTDATKGTPKSIMVSTKVTLLSNPVQEKGSQLVLRMTMLKDQLDKQQALLGQAANTLRHAISTKAAVNVVQVKQVIRSVLVNGPVSMGFAKLPEGLSMEGSKVSMNELHSKMPELQKAMSDIGFRIRKLVSALKDAVFKNKPATITAPKVLQGHLSTPLLKSAEANIGSIHGVPVAELFRNLYWMNKPTTITGKVTLARPAQNKVITPVPINKRHQSRQRSHNRPTLHYKWTYSLCKPSRYLQGLSFGRKIERHEIE